MTVHDEAVEQRRGEVDAVGVPHPPPPRQAGDLGPSLLLTTAWICASSP